MRKHLWVLAALVAASASAVSVAGEKGPGKAGKFFFKERDVIVMMGDSITEQRLYSNYVEAWCQTRFPTWKLVFRNVGIGGDRSTGGNSRFARDVVAYKPTALTVDFGMNDASYRAFDEKIFRTYVNGLQGIADQAKKANIRVAWITPQPVEERPGGRLKDYNDTLEKFSEGVKQVAERNDGLFVDQFHPYLAVMNKARAADPKNIIMGGDAVHPGPPGQALMAAAILKGMNFPRLVSAVEFDLGNRKPGRSPLKNAENCQVSNIKGRGDNAQLHFTRHDQALPFFPDNARSMLKWAPLLEEMNQYRLKVVGLADGNYEVRIGDQKVADHTAGELAAGVNLADAALKSGPIADQVKAVWKAVQDKTNYFHGQIFRGVVLAGPKSPIFKDVDPKYKEARRQEQYRKRMLRMPELDAAIQGALVTRPVPWAVVRVEK